MEQYPTIISCLWQFLTAKSKISFSQCSKKIYHITKDWNISLDQEILLKDNCIKWMFENAFYRGMNGGVSTFKFRGRDKGESYVVKFEFFLKNFTLGNPNYLYKVICKKPYTIFSFMREYSKYGKTHLQPVKELLYARDEYEDQNFLSRLKETIPLTKDIEYFDQKIGTK
jgi:hypothetical protein